MSAGGGQEAGGFRRSRQGLAAALALAAVLVWFVIFVVAPSATRHTGGFGAYYTASRLLAGGEISSRVYDHDYFQEQVARDSGGETRDIYTNPPANSLMLWPLAWLPTLQARLIWTALNVPLLFGALALVVRTWAARPDAATYALVFSAGLLFRPVVANFEYGQAYVLMFFLLTAAAVAYYRRRDGVGGGALALALMVKMVGWPLPLLLIWQRRWRFLLWTLGVSLLIVLLALPFLPLQMWLRFAQILPESSNSPYVCVTAYQTTRSFLCRFLAPGGPADAFAPPLPWQAMAVLGALALLTLVLNLRLAAREATAGFLVMIIWGILFAPVGEQHHHVLMLLPASWLIVQWRNDGLPSAAARGALLLALLCYVAPIPFLAPALQAGSRALLAYPRLYGAWLLLLSFYAGFGSVRGDGAPLSRARFLAKRGTS